MTEADLFANKINEFVKQYGTESILNVDQILDIAEMQDKKGSILPTDYCYNLYNKALGDFSGHHLFEYMGKDSFAVLGENYPFSGNIIHNAKDIPSYICGYWIEGELFVGDPNNIPKELITRRTNLEEGIRTSLKSVPVDIDSGTREITVKFQELLICGVVVEDDGYKIINVSSAWADKTSYLCEESSLGTWYYYLETIDECIGEIYRIVLFEANNSSGNTNSRDAHTSQLSKIFNLSAFKKSFEAFLAQADTNAITKKGSGGQVPYGFNSKPRCDGADVCTHYGMGAASKTPYLNWWVVSIYYLPHNGNVIIGIERSRYPHLKEMKVKPSRYSVIGNKGEPIAVFFSTTKEDVDYEVLYEKFLEVCEEVTRLGLK